MTRLKIRAQKDGDRYVMIADNGDLPQNGARHSTPDTIYRDMEYMWPSGGTWDGQWEDDNETIYSIEID